MALTDIATHSWHAVVITSDINRGSVDGSRYDGKGINPEVCHQFLFHFTIIFQTLKDLFRHNL
jgi:hypothetical protein